MKLYELLEEIVADVVMNYIIVGNKIITQLDKDRRIEMYLYNTFSSDSYDAIQLKVISKTSGVIDSTLLKFSSVFINHPNKIGKHIWCNAGQYNWYGKPTKEDIIGLREQINNYIEIWR